jgi:3-mercaptopropionate dioxygenase
LQNLNVSFSKVNTSFTQFIDKFTALIDTCAPEGEILSVGGGLLAKLVAKDDWLDAAYSKTHPKYYQQYLLYCDPQARFSVVSFVWGPGQETPVHNHTVWGLLGQLRGQEISTSYDDSLNEIGEDTLNPGDVEAVSPTIGDIHKVRNGHKGTSISIHVYGADIGKVERSVFYPETGKHKDFISGYSNV